MSNPDNPQDNPDTPRAIRPGAVAYIIWHQTSHPQIRDYAEVEGICLDIEDAMELVKFLNDTATEKVFPWEKPYYFTQVPIKGVEDY